MAERELKFPTRSLISQENQSMIERPDIPRSRFMGSWSRLTTFDAGQLVPFFCDEVLPGDHLKYKITPLVRIATLVFPIMSNQQVDVFVFFTANRLLWSKWKEFMGEATPAESAEPLDLTIPQVVSPAGGFLAGSLYDDFALPVSGIVDPLETISVNVLPLRAYMMIYDEWFRDQNNILKTLTTIGDGPDVATLYTRQNRAKAHDYFTSALPWPQKFVAPTVPLLGTAPVTGLAVSSAVRNPQTGPFPGLTETLLDNVTYPAYIRADEDIADIKRLYVRFDSDDDDAHPQIYADLTQATGVTINQLRQAFLVQQMLERDARGGTRYTEIIKSHFGVTSPDMRMQRPEYIGGGSSPLNVVPIAASAATTDQPTATLAGAGTATGSHTASYAATEHGWIIGLINVRSELAYQSGLHKKWSRLTREDHYFPSLAGLGEQAILTKEIYDNGVEIDRESVFGYQERWHEYRQNMNEVTKSFRSSAVPSLAQWHIAQDFGGVPTLQQAFLEDLPPMDRVVSAPDFTEGATYIANILIRREATRPIPVFGTPVTLGRF